MAGRCYCSDWPCHMDFYRQPVWLQNQFQHRKPFFHIGSMEDLSAPFEEVGTYTVDTDDINHIDVDWVSGSISITPYDGSEIVITEYARRELGENEKLVYEVNGSKLEIDYIEASLTFNMLTKKLEVLVPEALAGNLSRLSINSTSAELSVSSMTVDTLEINQTSGNSDLSDIQTVTAGVDSVSGEIIMDGLTISTLSLGTVSGDVMLTGTSADTVNTDSTSGDQYIEGTFNDLDLNSVSGEIHIASSVDPENLRCNTTSGDICVTIPGSDDIVVSYSTVSGDFTSEVPVITGGSNATYYFNTVSGDMEIRGCRVNKQGSFHCPVCFGDILWIGNPTVLNRP